MAPPSPAVSVAVIGAGPGGMFFCHALETYRRELKEQGDDAALAKLPVVTCLERAPGPGGVWRASTRTAGSSLLKDTKSSSSSTTDETQEKERDEHEHEHEHETAKTTNTMYDALWTNGPKEAIEFFDYTFDEHFGSCGGGGGDGDGGHPLPVYMPRQAILDYMIGRVTKHCPDFFEKYMTFNTRVDSVRFLEASSKFEIVTTTRTTATATTTTTSTTTTTAPGDEVATISTQYYDKCIWAAGMNGIPMTPPPMREMFLKDDGFKGKIIHSSEVATTNFEEDVQGKRVLLIGGSYSAEDLALMAVKCGVEKVYVSARHPNVVSWTAAWPYNKVEVLEEQIPVGVTEDGRCIQFAATEDVFADNDNNTPQEEVPIQTELRDIDTIIFCTGYLPNLDMLSEELRQAMNRDEEPELSVPKYWRMKPNKLTQILGDIEPDEDVLVTGPIHPGLYRDCISIENPDMMFMKFEFENPLFGIDVSAWLLLRSVVGTREIPSPAEMVKQEEHNALHTMNNPWYRCMMDKNYFEAIDKNWEKFPDRPESKLDLLDQFESEYDTEATTEIRILTRYMQEAQYPLSLGSFDELNETANRYIQFDGMTYDHRAQLTEDDADNGRTFRDYSNGDEFRSVFTGTSAVPLKKRWLDIDAHDPTILEP